MTREELKNELEFALNAYNQGLPTKYSDPEFDKLVDEYGYDAYIEEIKRPTMTQGMDFSHPIADLLVVQPPKIKIKAVADIPALADDEVMPYKFDGSSIVVYFNNGQRTAIVTRGNDKVGKIQTEKLGDIIPTTTDPDVIAVQCECMARKEDFGDGCRAKANGLINSVYLDDEVHTYLVIRPFNVFTKSQDKTYQQRMALIGNWAFDVDMTDKKSPWVIGEQGTLPIDGFVVYKGTTQTPNRIYKFYGLEYADTEVVDIEWNESPLHVFVPKLILKPIYLGGCNINKVASGGIDNMYKLGAGVGSKVRIVQNTVPGLLQVLETSHEYKLPNCPKCGNLMTKYQTGVHCTNDECVGNRMREEIKKIKDFNPLLDEDIFRLYKIPRFSQATLDAIMNAVTPPRWVDETEFFGWADEAANYITSDQQYEEFKRLNDIYFYQVLVKDYDRDGKPKQEPSV